MKAKVIFYSQKRILPKERTKFKKELAGHNDSSHGGKYKYRKKGLLDSIEHIKPCHAALIVKGKDYGRITRLIKKYGIPYSAYNIELRQKDFKR